MLGNIQMLKDTFIIVRHFQITWINIFEIDIYINIYIYIYVVLSNDSSVALSHCMKSVQIRSFFGPYFSVFGLNTRKYEPEKSPYLDTFHAVSAIFF